MIQGNYTVKAVAEISAQRETVKDKKTAALLDFIGGTLRYAQPFLLPVGGNLFAIERRKYQPAAWRLPYDVISLEYTDESDQPWPQLLLVWDEAILQGMNASPFGPPGSPIGMMHFMVSPSGEWKMALGAFLVPNEGPDADVSPWHFRSIHDLNGGSPGYSKEHADYLRDLDATILAQLLCALECKNVRIDDLAPPPRLQAKRFRQNKLPLLTYKVLTLDAEPSVVGAPGGGTHASPRTHLRRGHIRRLLSGNVWVNATVVKGATKGLVLKDYAVKPPPAVGQSLHGG